MIEYPLPVQSATRIARARATPSHRLLGGDGVQSATPGPDDVQPVEYEWLNRALTALITVGPMVALGFVGWQMWDGLLHRCDLIVFAILYLLTGLGITVGFHRLFTHRSFKTSPAVRGVLAVLGSAAIEGPIISWVADHRKHHAFSDKDGDPHSPHVDHGVGLRGALRGLAHAHLGWLFIHTERGSRERYAPDLIADPVVEFVDRTFFVWAIGGLAAAFGLGYAIGGTWQAGLTGLLWGGAVRMLVLHHMTYSINSLCHFFGRRDYATEDHSRNLLWLALPTLGEAWHNNHHAFPTSACHGLSWRQPDISALVIRGLERTGLAWDVVERPRERRTRARRGRSASMHDDPRLHPAGARDHRLADGGGDGAERPPPQPADGADPAHARLRPNLGGRRGRAPDRLAGPPLPRPVRRLWRVRDRPQPPRGDRRGARRRWRRAPATCRSSA